MSESSQKRIDIEEFERRLRAPAAPQSSDPLAELARLVSGPSHVERDPIEAMFAQPERVEPSFDGFAGRPLNPNTPDLDGFQQNNWQNDVRSHESDLARLRGAFEDHAHQPAGGFHGAPQDAGYADEMRPETFHPSSEYDGWAAENGDLPPPLPDYAPAKPRSRVPLYATAAVVLVGLTGIGASMAFRGGTGGSQSVATINAASGPVKVQPADTGKPDNPGADASILNRSAAVAPVKQVSSREEQPVDLSQAQKPSTRVIGLNGQNAEVPAGAGAASVVTPPPPRLTNGTAGVFPEPRKVKTVSVRPDGSLITSETAASPAPPQRPSAAAAQPAATPPAAKNATPKSVARIATTPKAGNGETDETPATKPAAKPKPVAAKPATKPQQVARVADPDEQQNEPVETPARAAAAPSGGGSGFSVQLAAPGTEAEARSTASRLGTKFSDALGGRRPGVQKASDKAVYRVRVSGYSREAAVEACESIKTAGGTCFVARN